MATYQQGVIIDGMLTVYGLAQRSTKRTAVRIITARDENDQVAAAVQVDPEANPSFEFVMDLDETLPDLTNARTTPVVFEYDEDGSAGSGNAHDYLIESIEDVEENANYRRCTISCRRWLANAIPATTTGS